MGDGLRRPAIRIFTMTIPATIVAGYLGAGKTTLINRLLARPDLRNVAVLVNDFGAVNIDAALIRAHDGEALSLANGCVCCSIADDLAAALSRVLAMAPAPARIIIEASGVADPAKIAFYAQGWPGLHLDGVLTLVDAEQGPELARDKFVGPTVRRQISAADLLLVSKTDLAAVPDAWLRALAPDLPVIAASDDPAAIFDLPEPRSRATADYQHPAYDRLLWQGAIKTRKRIARDTEGAAGIAARQGRG